MSTMRYTNQGLTMWYGSPDAPAPLEDSIEGRHGVSVTVGVQPPSPTNVVSVQYRVDEGGVQTARGVHLRTDYANGIEYHQTVLPDFQTGARVAYLPILSNAGRCVPEAGAATALPSSFRLGPQQPSSAPTRPEAPPASATAKVVPALEYLASIRVPLQEPEIIGVTPAGLLVNWFWAPREGEISGPLGRAKVRQVGGDWMNIRRDGVGVMDVRATVEVEDGALLFVSYLGSCDFGENGYQNFLDHRWPDSAPTRTAPRIETAHPKYLWANRLQCVGIGAVDMRKLVYSYDLFALR